MSATAHRSVPLVQFRPIPAQEPIRLMVSDERLPQMTGFLINLFVAIVLWAFVVFVCCRVYPIINKLL